MPIFENADGLTHMYGLSESEDAKTGSPKTDGAFHQHYTEVDFGGSVPTVAAGSSLASTVPMAAIEAGALIRSATLIVTTAFAGATATLSIGARENDGTVIDADGIDVQIAVTAIDAIGDEVACDGALINTILAEDTYIDLHVETADFTAGEGTLIIEYFLPTA